MKLVTFQGALRLLMLLPGNSAAGFRERCSEYICRLYNTSTDASMVEVVMEEVNTSMVVEIDTSIDRSLVNDTLPSALSEAFPEFFGRIRMDTASRMFCATDIVGVATAQDRHNSSKSLRNIMMKYPDFAVLVQEGKINNKVSHRGFRPRFFYFYFCSGHGQDYLF